MGALPFFIFTGIFGVIGIVFPIIAPKGPNRGYEICRKNNFFIVIFNYFQNRPVCLYPDRSDVLVIVSYSILFFLIKIVKSCKIFQLDLLLHGTNESINRS